MTDTDLAFASIEEVAQLFRKRKLSPVELTKLMLARIDQLNHKLNAYITVIMRARTMDGRSESEFDHPQDAWVLEYAAPPQLGWAHVSAFAIVDGRSGKVMSFSEDKTN